MYGKIPGGEEIVKLRIKEKFSKDYITREAGEKLRKMICQASPPIELDFEELKVASSSFFDEGIAKLSLEGFDAKWVNENITFLNLHKLDAALLKQVCLARGIKLNW